MKCGDAIRISCLLVTLFLAGCGLFTKPLNHPRVRPNVDPYNFRTDLPPFLESLTRYDNMRDHERAEYYVMYYVLKEIVEVKGAHSPQGLLLDRLLKLDVYKNPDSVAAVFKIAFKDLDPKPGPPNEFMTDDIPKRAEFILSHGCFHPGWELPFDQMAKDVARMGVPVIEAFGENSFNLYFPIPQLARYYEYSETYGYRSGTPPPEFTLTGEPMPPDMRYNNPTKSVLLTEMEEIENKIYTEVSYDLLRQILIQPFIYPAACTIAGAEDSTLDRQDWLCYRIGIDVFGILDEIETIHYKEDAFLDLILKYSINNPLTSEIILSDSIRYASPLAGMGDNKIYKIRTMTRPFHERSENRPVANSEYILDICVAAVIDTVTQNLKGNLRSEVYTLPDDMVQIPHYDLCLVSAKQHAVRQYSNPLEDIPDFAPGAQIHRGDYTEIWLPVTNLPAAAGDSGYAGWLSVYLVEKTESGGWAGIDEKSIRFGRPGDTLRPAEASGPDSLIESHQPHEIYSGQIKSATPDLYCRFRAQIPADVATGDDYMLMAFVYGLDPKTNRVRSICTSSMDVTVR